MQTSEDSRFPALKLIKPEPYILLRLLLSLLSATNPAGPRESECPGFRGPFQKSGHHHPELPEEVEESDHPPQSGHRLGFRVYRVCVYEEKGNLHTKGPKPYHTLLQGCIGATRMTLARCAVLGKVVASHNPAKLRLCHALVLSTARLCFGE